MAKKKRRDSRDFHIVLKSPVFHFVEAYKTLRTNLSFISMNNKYKKIIITSALPSEGKSNITINLAISLAENGSKVLVVDTDLRKPRAHEYLHIKDGKKSGVTSILSGVSNFKDSMVRFTDLGIDVLPAGPIPPNPTEMLNSDAMGKLIDELEQIYDYVIFDAPPASLVTDAAILCKYCDGVIFVIRQKHATIEQIREAKNNLENVNANIIGCVLNDYDSGKSGKYGGYGYKNYSYKYGYSYSEK